MRVRFLHRLFGSAAPAAEAPARFDPALDAELIAALDCLDLARMRAALAAGANPDAREPSSKWMAVPAIHMPLGHSPRLSLADGDLLAAEAIEILAEAGADLEAPGVARRSPLRAAILGPASLVSALVRCGALIDARGDRESRGRTALMDAVDIGAFEATRALMALGADAGLIDLNGRFALELSITPLRPPHCLRALLEFDADLSGRDPDGFDALALAVDRAAPEHEALIRNKLLELDARSERAQCEASAALPDPSAPRSSRL